MINIDEKDVDELSCSICLMEIVANNDAVLDCNHQFHIDCIKQWGNQKAICPLCKRPFTRISFDGQFLLVSKKGGKRKRYLHAELFGEEGNDDDDGDDNDDDDDAADDDDEDDDDGVGLCLICLGACEVESSEFCLCRTRNCSSVVHQFCIGRSIGDNSSWLCAECSIRSRPANSNRYSSSSRNNSSRNDIRISDSDTVAMRHPKASTESSKVLHGGDELAIKQQLLPFTINGKNSRELIEKQISIARRLNVSPNAYRPTEATSCPKLSEDEIIEASKEIIKNEKTVHTTSHSRKTAATSTLLSEVLGANTTCSVSKKLKAHQKSCDNEPNKAAYLQYKSSGYDIFTKKSAPTTTTTSAQSQSSSVSMIIKKTSSTSEGAAALFISRLRAANNERMSNRDIKMTGLFHEIKSFSLSTDIVFISRLLELGLLNELSDLLYPQNNKWVDYRDREMILRTVNCLPVTGKHVAKDSKILKALSHCMTLNDVSSHGNLSALSCRILKVWRSKVV